jgi:hypothetical protein
MSAYQREAGVRLRCPIESNPAAGADAREERLAQNELLFRSVNEAIEQQAIEFGGEGYEFICECSSSSCFERISLTLLEYEHVRSDGVRFFVAPGHQNVAVELIVDAKPTFVIVEKDGAAGIIAANADPRDGDPPLH